MMNPTSIARYVRQDRLSQLFEALIGQGQYLPGAIQAWLSNHTRPATLAMGLKRVVELTRMATPASDLLLDQLLEAQEDDGSYEDDPLLTALAVAAMFQLIHDHRSSDARLIHAHQHALQVLALMQDQDGRFYSQTQQPAHTNNTIPPASLFDGLLTEQPDTSAASSSPNGRSSSGTASASAVATDQDAAMALPWRESQLFSACILQLLARNPQARQRLQLNRLLVCLEQQNRTQSPQNQDQDQNQDIASCLRIARAGLPREVPTSPVRVYAAA